MKDVARLAGVSHQTVSRVLNDHPSVRTETRERVLRAMRDLDYRRNTAARALVTQRSQTLGLVSFDTTLAGPSFMVYAIEQAARDAGYFVSISSARSLVENSVWDAINRLREQAVEGIITIAPMDSARAALGRVPRDMPVVGVGVGDLPGVAMVGVDNAVGARLAVRHLLELGHATVHHIAGPVDWPESQQRIAGWRAELDRAGAPEPPVLTGDWGAQSGYEAVSVLAADPAVTALFCANDHMALGALRALGEARRAVPGEVSLVGFDDIPEAAYLYPRLTTVRQDFAEVGRRSLELLIEQITSGTRATSRVLFPPHLVVRDSAGPPRR